MTPVMIAENHRRYVERIALLKRFGYDVEAGRADVLEAGRPLEGRILEVGTGKGYFTVALARESCVLTSLDISEEEQSFARANVEYYGYTDRVDFRIGDAARLPFPDDSFDLVFSVNTIHHLAAPVAALDEMARVAAPTGRIVIADFNAAGFAAVDRAHRSEGRRHEAITATLEGLRAHLAGRGYDVTITRRETQDILVARPGAGGQAPV